MMLMFFVETMEMKNDLHHMIRDPKTHANIEDADKPAHACILIRSFSFGMFVLFLAISTVG